MTRGRPDEFKKEYIEKVDEYLETQQDEEFDIVKSSGKGGETYERKIKVRLPTVEGFALFLDVSKRVLYDWEKKHPSFLHALNKIRTEQKKRLVNMGLSGDYNPTIAKLILSSNHDMREGSDITTGGDKLTTLLDECEKQN
jgi:hypothetical protein